MSGRFLPNKKSSPGGGDIARPVHYVSDGKGRDSYITTTDGGLTHPNRPCDPRVTFSKNLRQYNRLDNYLTQRNYNLANLKAGSVFRQSSVSILNSPIKEPSFKKIQLFETTSPTKRQNPDLITQDPYANNYPFKYP